MTTRHVLLLLHCAGWSAAIAGFAITGAASVRAQEAKPTFDCSRATGAVEPLICKDPALAALDQQLAEVYAAALAEARDGMPARLRAEQRGWISGRNECWKADGQETYITASWTVSTVHECVEANYRVRIAELQATWRLVDARPPVFYTCANNPANEIVATFFPTEPQTVRLERGDSTVTAWQVPAASGAKYEGQNVVFWTKGNEAAVTWREETLPCRAR